MSTTSIPKEQLKELKGAFAWIDHDGNNMISSGDLERAFKSLGQTRTNEEIKGMMKDFNLDSESDSSNSSKVSLPMYLQGMSSLMSAMDNSEELMEAFAAFDENDNGYIPLDTLQEAIFNHDSPDMTDGEKEIISVFRKFMKRRAGNESFMYTKFIDTLNA